MMARPSLSILVLSTLSAPVAVTSEVAHVLASGDASKSNRGSVFDFFRSHPVTASTRSKAPSEGTQPRRRLFRAPDQPPQTTEEAQPPRRLFRAPDELPQPAEETRPRSRLFRAPDEPPQPPDEAQPRRRLFRAPDEPQVSSGLEQSSAVARSSAAPAADHLATTASGTSGVCWAPASEKTACKLMENYPTVTPAVPTEFGTDEDAVAPAKAFCESLPHERCGGFIFFRADSVPGPNDPVASSTVFCSPDSFEGSSAPFGIAEMTSYGYERVACTTLGTTALSTTEMPSTTLLNSTTASNASSTNASSKSVSVVTASTSTTAAPWTTETTTNPNATARVRLPESLRRQMTHHFCFAECDYNDQIGTMRAQLMGKATCSNSSGVTFDAGKKQWMKIKSGSARLGGGSMTLSLWARLESFSSDARDTRLFSFASKPRWPWKAELSLFGWNMQDEKKCPLRLRVRESSRKADHAKDTSTTQKCKDTDTIGQSLKQWFLATVTVNSTTNTSKLYLNGDLSREYDEAVIPKLERRHMWFGKRLSRRHNGDFKGQIRSFSTWDRALTPKEVMELYWDSQADACR